MMARILGADRRLRSICKENQPTKIADWIGECLVLEEARVFPSRKITALDRNDDVESESWRLKTES